MTDFTDHYAAFCDEAPTVELAKQLLEQRTTCTIHCDTENCDAYIFVNHDVDEYQSAAMVRAAGWTACMGVHRWSHHCGRCSEVKR